MSHDEAKKKRNVAFYDQLKKHIQSEEGTAPHEAGSGRLRALKARIEQVRKNNGRA